MLKGLTITWEAPEALKVVEKLERRRGRGGEEFRFIVAINHNNNKHLNSDIGRTSRI